jgi:siroheme synthase-like protein
VGQRKLAALLKAGAKIRVVEPNPEPVVLKLYAEGLIRLEKVFDETYLEACPLVFVAVDDAAESAAITNCARSKGLLVNSADRPSESDFFLPAVVDEDPFRVAVSTDGASPALAASVAAELRERYRGYGKFTELLGRLRPLIMASDLDSSDRRRLFFALANDSQLLKFIKDGSYCQARELIAKHLGKVKLPIDFPLP